MGIVIATDLTDSSTDAARYAVTLAKRDGVGITVAHVIGSTDIDTTPVIAYRYQMHQPEPDARSVVNEFEREKAAEVKRWFEDIAGELDGVDVSYAVEFGDLPDVIWRIVGNVEADSLIVGVHGHQSVGRHVNRILLDATIPVVVVREGIIPATADG